MARSFLPFLAILAACGGSAHPAARVPVDPPPAAPAASPASAPVAAAPAVAPPELTDAQVIERSKAFFDAIDRAKPDELAEQAWPHFMWFEFGRFKDLETTRKWLDGRNARNEPLRTRTWQDEETRVSREPGFAVFVGHAIEHLPAQGDRAAADQDGFNTLVWVNDGAKWRAAYWQWEVAGVEAEKQTWNNIFRVGFGFNHEPNKLLVETVKGRKPGTALDLLMGQGRNAVFLATAGWKTTGVDISDEGMKIAREAAAHKKVKLETIESDIANYDLGKDKWDLVTMIYAGDDLPLAERAKKSIKKGGLFVTEYFAKGSEASSSGAGGWDRAELAKLFKDGWKILRDEEVEDVADYSQRPQKLVRFVAQKL